MKIPEVLNIDSFDPMGVDVSYIQEVADQIPRGAIQVSIADNLATITLAAADRCGDLLAQSTLYLSHCDATRRAAKSKAIKEASSRKVPSTIVKETVSDDEEFVKATNKYNIALAWHTWLENKHASLLKTHHLCKDLLKRGDAQLSAAGWTPTVISDDDDRKPTSVREKPGRKSFDDL